MSDARIAPWLSTSRWPTAPIRLVARLGSGHTPSRSKPEYWKNCTTPWVTLADVWQLRSGQKSVITDTKEKISSLGEANSAAVKHPAGTVILSRTASVGFSAIMGRDMATSQDFATWTCGPRLHPRYLLHALRGMAPDLKRIAMGSTHKTIYMPDIEQLRVPLPPLEEQHRIADFLDAETALIDQLMALRERQRQLLQSRQDASIHDLFSKFETSHARLKHLLAARPRYGVLVPKYAEDGVRFVRVNDLLDLPGRSHSLITIAPETSAQYPTTVVRAGDVLVSVVGTLGRAAVAPQSIAGANVNRAIAVLRPMPHVDRNLMAAWINAGEFQEQALLATGNDSAQRTLGMEDMANFVLRWPNNQAAQAELAKKVQRSTELTQGLTGKLQKQTAVLAERRQALITAAVTGQFDVSTASGRNVTDGVPA